jgi:hypothetical protein
MSPYSGLQVKHFSHSISGCPGALQRWHPIRTMGEGEGLEPGISQCEMQQLEIGIPVYLMEFQYAFCKFCSILYLLILRSLFRLES